jgi:4-hydroxyphenylpyruvate dioxygenase-like putative hemolysin
MINNLHHFEILTKSSGKLLNYFINGFKFKLVLTKQSGTFRQYLLNSNSINFLVTSLEPDSHAGQAETGPIYSTPLPLIQKNHPSLFRTIANKGDTVFNAAFQVRDLDRIIFNCNKHNVPIIKKKHVLIDEDNRQNGFVECAVINSCIDGVVHSLFNLNDYKGAFLPGYELKQLETDNHEQSLATHFDHLTYAVHKNTSNPIIQWYTNIFNMRHFRINREESDGLIVKTGDSGMNLKAIRYWLCAETGVQFKPEARTDRMYNNDFKFVISEPLDEETSGKKSRNQISIFLDEHKGPGIQHIGLHTPNIVESVAKSKENSDQVKYYATPDVYYETVIILSKRKFKFFNFNILLHLKPDKVEEIEKCGLDVEVLKRNHILLDAEFNENSALAAERTNQTESSSTNEENLKPTENKPITTFLLQVFTQPIFAKNTVFLELIQRVGDAQGFGAANIKALWNAVQYEINNKLNN